MPKSPRSQSSEDDDPTWTPRRILRVTRTYSHRRRESGNTRSIPINLGSSDDEESSNIPPPSALATTSTSSSTHYTPTLPSPESSSTGTGVEALNSSQAEPVPLPSHDSALARFEDILARLTSSNECPICFQLFSQPYTLKGCGHTFCACCLNGVRRSNTWVEGQFRRYRPCPVCREPIKVMPQKAYIVKHTADILREALDLASPPSQTLIWSNNDFPPPIRRFPHSNGDRARQPTPFPLSP
ncbi:hypothetical protein BT96DRAFT_949982 [Gymnopus androsaceus JB14]|uniref:RING-type domain-containing protein n=1 Tax=Gymnopus androsaceus JB14 TaxID=1447944 RepID=A0A6A4GIV5_9AGAR|nr:hypothetical protein BT96DRAFT_949982 [Gymnopus androsaceus JB14]